ncbi:hypothetical protein GQ55_2G318900 [Panicum hallii var. hallii]|uniref:Solute carrier family 35 member F1 n=1 Tax=Panicum hallii var. hallii TaxID=1504633 RepID=A0A2T7EUJ6_9POAL|nr:hypothetical protein GQ55_2G318900 [Panicum hallii var. hallii]
MAPPPWWLRREVLVGLALGQFVSLLITSTGFSSSELARRGVNAPTSQSLLNYILLALVYGGTLIYKRRHLTVKWYYYLLLGIIDVEANYIEGPNPLKGDLLVIGGSMLYAISNVTEEYFVKKSNRVEVMAMLGLFGAIISGIQISILERQELRSTHWNASAILPFIGFAVAMFLFYSTVPIILKICGATMLNLSLLTSDMWAVLIRIFAYHEKVDWMYFVAFAGTAIGLVIYSYKGSKQIAEETAQVTGAGDEEAATANRTAQVPCVGDDGPSSNKEFASAATASR